ncbi:thiamine kinase [Shigella flexneri]
MPDTNELAGLLYYLHQQPRFGWPITLLPLLELYWQQSDSARRTVGWLRTLKRLRKAREPRPLRLSPLHMDVHAGNLVHSASGLKLIDWEYAGDREIALELAAVWVKMLNSTGNWSMTMPLARRFIRRNDGVRSGDGFRLLMLKAGWFEYRWRQTGNRRFIRLADHTWRRLINKTIRRAVWVK